MFHDVKSYAQMSANVSWDGMVGLVSRGVAEIVIANYAVTKNCKKVRKTG
jgi:hypothetical protein